MAKNEIEILEAQIRDCFGRVVWTHKIQEKCADILLDQSKRAKGVQLLLSAITTSKLSQLVAENFDALHIALNPDPEQEAYPRKGLEARVPHHQAVIIFKEWLNSMIFNPRLRRDPQ